MTEDELELMELLDDLLDELLLVATEDLLLDDDELLLGTDDLLLDTDETELVLRDGSTPEIKPSLP